MPVYAPLIGPFLVAMLLMIFRSSLSKNQSATLGVLGIFLSFISSLACALHFASEQVVVREVYGMWLSFGDSAYQPIMFGLQLDALSLVMILVVSLAASLIALYSVSFMHEEEHLSKFFAVMNLFVAFMLVLVLADNLLLLFLGWEGVGLCSYLLVGYWYSDRKNGLAAMKAFITTKIGDVILLFGIIALFLDRKTLLIQGIQTGLSPALATMVALCVLGGAIGKSAQAPLHVWLPDAMVGPTPVSALIHAATMVTAGVYAIARLSPIFALSHLAQYAVLAVGLVTLLYAGICALVQKDVKKVLAYSTISQLGYMFLALGAQAYTAAIFHLMTHAFFKALLFLLAGALGYAMHHNYDMTKMGGLKNKLPLLFYLFLIGASSLASLPLVTASFYSKEFILGGVYGSAYGGVFAWMLGIVGAFVTGLYSFRMVFLIFFGKEHGHVSAYPDLRMNGVMIAFAVLSMVSGFVQTPHVLGDIQSFHNFLAPTVYVSAHEAEHNPILLLVAMLASLASVLTAYLLFGPQRARKLSEHSFIIFVRHGLGFDWLYEKVILQPYRFMADVTKFDPIAMTYELFGELLLLAAGALSALHAGRVRMYSAFITGCLVLALGIVVFS